MPRAHATKTHHKNPSKASATPPNSIADMARTKWDALNAEWQTLRREFHAPSIDIANKEVGELESLISAESYTEDDLVEMLQRVVFALVSSGDSLGPF